MLWNTNLVFQLEENRVMWQCDFFFLFFIVQPQFKIILHLNKQRKALSSLTDL